VNEFLATPWLRSKGLPIEVIDDDITLSRRWWRLPHATRSALQNKRLDERVLKAQDASFGVGDIKWGRGTLSRDMPTYRALVAACRASAEEGYFCYDEMFVWAHDLLNIVPEVAAFLRTRFPLLFIDEVQDNSEMQSKLLHRVFVEGEGAVFRQRYGDANQAIYQYAGQTEGAMTDRFPIANISTTIPNSFRFGAEIATFADPLGVVPHGLQGRRPIKDGESDTTGRHTIFLFDDDSISRVLEVYAAYLIEVFSEQERQEGVFTAVGAIHRDNGNANLPRHVGQYWADYDHSISRSDPQPETFIQYLNAGRRLAESGDAYPLVEKLAEAVIRSARVANPELTPGMRKRKHRHVLELLADHPEAKDAYLEIVRDLAVEQRAIDENQWANRWRPSLIQVVQAISGEHANIGELNSFLVWRAGQGAAIAEQASQRSDNVFRYPPQNPGVSIRVGSIHAVKGETHTATLVLETYYRTHHLAALKAWLLGTRHGGNGETDALKSRLKLHYVAMSRASRLLCLALRESTLSRAEIQTLLGRGWRVARIGRDGPEWFANE
jgi:superfamily I DNA/RNA helicase